MSRRKKLFLFTLVMLVLCFVVLDRMNAPQNSPELSAYAEETVRSFGKELPPYMFAQDGCTLFPEKLFGSDWSRPCLEHDIRYWVGGSIDERKAADRLLRDGVKESGTTGAILSPLVYYGVRFFGDTWLTKLFDAHWGFGWDD